MRISDCSSDVCSSDLSTPNPYPEYPWTKLRRVIFPYTPLSPNKRDAVCLNFAGFRGNSPTPENTTSVKALRRRVIRPSRKELRSPLVVILKLRQGVARMSVVEGKSVEVGVSVG